MAARSCWLMASNAPRKAAKCRGSKAFIRSPAAMPGRPSSWATPCNAVALLVQAAGVYLAVPVAARIHEGVVWTACDRRTLLDKLSGLLLGLQWSCALTVVADAYYAAAKFARSLLAHGHHLVTRVRSNAVAYFPPSKARCAKRRGRRSIYGPKTQLRDWFRYRKQ